MIGLPSMLGVMAWLIAWASMGPTLPPRLDDPPTEKTSEDDARAKDRGASNEVVARIGDEIVTRMELAKELKRREALGSRSVGHEIPVLVDMVQSMLLRKKAESLQIKVDDDRVDRVFDSKVEQFGGMETFQRVLTREGHDAESYKAFIKESLTFSRIVRDRHDLTHKNRVTPREIKDYWHRQFPKEEIEPDKVELDVVRLRFGSTATPSEINALVDQVVGRLGEGLTVAEACEGIDKASPQNSMKITLDGENRYMPAIMAFAEERTPEGTVSEPIELSNGDAILLVSRSFAPGKVHRHQFDDPKVQFWIRSHLEDMKYSMLLRHYIREIVVEFEVWPEGLARVISGE